MLFSFTETLLINLFSLNFFLTATFSRSSIHIILSVFLALLSLNQLSSSLVVFHSVNCSDEFSFTLVNFIVILSSIIHNGTRISSFLHFERDLPSLDPPNTYRVHSAKVHSYHLSHYITKPVGK
jgi:hypothetical protein